MQKYIISVDWFQVTCKRNPNQCISEGMYFQGILDNDEGKKLIYEIRQGREYNAIFNNCLSVCLHHFPIASIFCEPRPQVLKPHLCMIKLANPILYSPRWLWYLDDIMAALGWSFLNISRIDICADFNEFSGGLLPVDFIRRYLSSEDCTESATGFYRVGGNKYVAVARKKIGSGSLLGLSETCCFHEGEYLRFGVRSSGVCTYLYNKTRELDESGRKKYIRDLWARAGLLDSVNSPVFRLEFSISPAAMCVKRRRSQEEQNDLQVAKSLVSSCLDNWNIDRLSLNDFETQRKIEDVFWGFASKYFRFKRISTQKYPHNWPDAVLFDVNFDTPLKPYRVARDNDSGVSERNAINCLSRLLLRNPKMDIIERVHLDATCLLLEKISGIKRKQIDKKTTAEILRCIKSGHNWDEIYKMKICSAGQLDEFRELVETHAANTISRMCADSSVSRALDEYEFTQSELKELAKIEDYVLGNE